MSDATPTQETGSRFLNFIEVIGNRLPDPITLFALGAALVMIASEVAVQLDWEVTPVKPEIVTTQVTDADGQTHDEPVIDKATGKSTIRWIEQPKKKEKAKSLLTSDGLFWAISSMADNFGDFPPLRIVLVGMLGIGVAELTGLIGVLLKVFMLVVPRSLLTPAIVFIGIMSSMTLDAGYIVLPPIAAALYQAAGRSPLAGIAASFAGVSAGFNANLLITGLDPMLAQFSADAAQIIDSNYRVAATCNWYFMIVSTVTMTLTGWATTALIVERRLAGKSPEEGGPVPPSDHNLKSQQLTPDELAGLKWALSSAIVVGILYYFMIRTEGWPLQGMGEHFKRWVEAIVPLIFIGFIVPGIAYGIQLRTIASDKDVSKLLSKSMAMMAPIIVLSFFAAQFIKYFNYSNLDRMLAMTGGQALANAQLPPLLLIVAFILMTAFFNLFVGSMSAKYAMFASIFVPMLMMVGISPELTQASYRIGDSITNIITPLNAYLVIVLVFIQKYVPKAGMGTLISSMMPYTFTFGAVWIIQIVIWYLAGWPLGEGGPLHYPPA